MAASPKTLLPLFLSSVWLFITLATGGLAPAPAFAVCLAALYALSRPGKNIFDGHPDAALVLTLTAFYLSTFRWHGGDDAPNSLLPFCLLRHGTLSLDPVIDPWFVGKLDNFTVVHLGRRLSTFPVGPAILALPVYLVTALSGVEITEPALHGLSKLSGALLTALSAAALRRALLGRCSDRFALSLAFLYGLGTWAFSVSSQALWQHGPASLGVALGLWGFNRRGFRFDALAGFGLGLAVASRPDTVFFAVAGAAYVLLFDRQRLPGFALGAAMPAILLGAYWLAYTGVLRPPEFAIQSRPFRGFQPSAFFGMLVSPTRGIFLFFPPAVFSALAIRRSRDALTRLMAAACAGVFLLFCFHNDWVGGSTFGTRYLASVALVLCWSLAPLESWLAASRDRARAWSVAAAAAFVIHGAGAYLMWPGSNQLLAEKAELWRWTLHPLANAVTHDGALRSLPFLARALILIAAGALAWSAARRLQTK
ncbi:MAG: hypothetical protein HY923_05370 [Elusimicrobia bacterium]|nr:hypothetical protein [Elusimicrobiota bacterium]